MADSKEAQFQQDVISVTVAQDWLTSTTSVYFRRMTLDTEVHTYEC